MAHKTDLAAIGNAIVDVLAHCDDQFLTDHDIPKGGMQLIGAEMALNIYKAMGTTEEVAGGSAANSTACLASLGGSAGFIGKVGQDRLGETFRASLRDEGVTFDTAAMEDQTPTGRCLINVTPDAERSMSTFIGAAEFVAEADIDEELVAGAAVTFFEGYLFEQPVARAAMEKACTIAAANGRKASITLSNEGCVQRQRAHFRKFISDHVDVLLANEAEAKELADVKDFTAVPAALCDLAEVIVITRSEKGSVIVTADSVEDVPSYQPSQLVDTTGAGDAFAGGFFYGLTREMPLAACAQIGSAAATEVISHMGPRPQKNLAEFAKGLGAL